MWKRRCIGQMWPVSELWPVRQRQFKQTFLRSCGAAHRPGGSKARAKRLAAGVFHWSVPEKSRQSYLTKVRCRDRRPAKIKQNGPSSIATSSKGEKNRSSMRPPGSHYGSRSLSDVFFKLQILEKTFMAVYILLEMYAGVWTNESAFAESRTFFVPGRELLPPVLNVYFSCLLVRIIVTVFHPIPIPPFHSLNVHLLTRLSISKALSPVARASFLSNLVSAEAEY